jgi:hypothetical protein
VLPLLRQEHVVGVINIDMLGAVNDSPGLVGVLVKVGKWMQVALSIELLPLLGGSVFSHDNWGRHIILELAPFWGFLSEDMSEAYLTIKTPLSHVPIGAVRLFRRPFCGKKIPQRVKNSGGETGQAIHFSALGEG